MFHTISFLHVYRELNTEADTLSKEGIQLVVNNWVISECKDGSVLNESTLVVHES